DKKVSKKRRRHSIMAFEMIRLDRTAAEPLHQQLYRQIRDELVSGSFTDNSSRLPSTRALAADLGISRLTVNIAFEKLHAEGYLRSRMHRAGATPICARQSQPICVIIGVHAAIRARS